MSLKKVLILTFLVLLLSSFVNIKYVSAQTNNKLKSKVTSLTFSEEKEQFVLTITMDKNVTYTSYTAETPWKLILEFPSADFSNFLGEKEVGKDGVKSYLVKHIGSIPNQIGRVEVNFLGKPDFNIEKTKNTVTVMIKKMLNTDMTKASQETVKVAEPITINNLLFSGEHGKFVVILETTGKLEFMSYVLKNPLRIVFDLNNAKYEVPNTTFVTKNNIVKGIRAESFPSLTRLFLDIATDSMPSFLSKAEKDKLIIEFTTEEVKEKAKEVTLLENIEFLPGNGKASFRFKGIGDKEYKVYKLREDMLVFDFIGINLHKDIQKTFDTRDVSDLIKSFTLYQVKPEEENKVRFVVDLKVAAPYKTVKTNGDILLEFYREKALPKETATVKKEPVAKAPVSAPPVVAVAKKEETAKKEEQPITVVKPKQEVKEPEAKPKKEPVVAKVEEPKLSEKKEELVVKDVAKEEPKPVEKKEEVAIKEVVKEQPKPEPKVEIKPEPKVTPLPSVEPPKPKEEVAAKQKAEKPEKPVVVTIKPKEEKAEEKKLVKDISSQYKGRPITINLKDAEIQHIFKLIAEVAKLDGEILNIVTSDDVRGKVSIQLEEVPWDQVLDVIMEVNNLGMKRIGNIVRVMPKEKLKKEQEDLIAASKIKEKLGNLVLEIVPVNYADASDFEGKIKPLLSTRGSVTLDKRNNSLIINDLKENIDEAKKLIAKLDTPPQQVVIEARVVEANSDFSKEMGIQWGAKFFKDINNRYRTGISGASSRTDPTGTASFPSGAGGGAALDFTGTAASPIPYFVNLPAATGQGAGGGINFALINLRNGVGLDIQLTAMENKGVGKILSRPRITTLNNIEANIQQGSSIPYETLSDKGTQTQFIDANLMLTVTPRITPDNSIILKVKVSNNNPNTALRSARGVPSIDKNEASTEILVRDGQTIVIGGIIRNKEGQVKSGIPFLMDIPVIGWLFKKEVKTVENRELLIFLTPNIIKNIVESEAS